MNIGHIKHELDKKMELAVSEHVLGFPAALEDDKVLVTQCFCLGLPAVGCLHYRLVDPVSHAAEALASVQYGARVYVHVVRHVLERGRVPSDLDNRRDCVPRGASPSACEADDLGTSRDHGRLESRRGMLKGDCA